MYVGGFWCIHTYSQTYFQLSSDLINQPWLACGGPVGALLIHRHRGRYAHSKYTMGISSSDNLHLLEQKQEYTLQHCIFLVKQNCSREFYKWGQDVLSMYIPCSDSLWCWCLFFCTFYFVSFLYIFFLSDYSIQTLIGGITYH